jgi:hypothetical protein
MESQVRRALKCRIKLAEISGITAGGRIWSHGKIARVFRQQSPFLRN